MYIVGRCLLSDILAELRMTQQDLADKMNVTKQQINSYATNKAIMSLLTAKNIAAILGCSVEDLYEWKPVNVRTKRR